MSGSEARRLEILAQVVASQEDGTHGLCDVCRDATGATGAGIMLLAAATSEGSLCNSDDVSALIEKLQFDLGEGPSIDAFDADTPVLEPDLTERSRTRWPAFVAPAVDAGVCAIFAFPLRVGAARMGVLNLYRDRAGPLTDAQHSDALLVADVCARTVLLLQAGAPPGTLAIELEAGGEFHWIVHQAAGMVAAQLEVSVLDALVRLRAEAFGSGRDLTDVSREVVDRRLRLEGDNGSHHT